MRDERLRPELYYALTTLVLRLRPAARAPRRAAGPGATLPRARQSARGPAAGRLRPGGDRGADRLRLAGEPPRAGPRHRARPRPPPDGHLDRRRTTCPRRSAATWAAPSPRPLRPDPIKPLDELLTEVERRADRDRAAAVAQQQVPRRRDPRHLPPAALSPDQGAQPPRRRRAGRGRWPARVRAGLRLGRGLSGPPLAAEPRRLADLSIRSPRHRLHARGTYMPGGHTRKSTDVLDIGVASDKCRFMLGPPFSAIGGSFRDTLRPRQGDRREAGGIVAPWLYLSASARGRIRVRRVPPPGCRGATDTRDSAHPER